MSIDREREIHRRVNERYLLTTGDQWANQQDPQFHLNVKMVRQLLAATEEAMNAETIPVDVRDRVIYRLLYGEAPESYSPPDWREAANRQVGRDKAMVRLAQTPIKLPPHLGGTERD